MMALIPQAVAALGLTRTRTPLLMCQAQQKISHIIDIDASFYRGSDLLQAGEAVSAREVVNVLGRWKSYSDWDSIGGSQRIDDFRNGDFYEEDLPTFKTDFTLPDHMARRPQRRDFCVKYGLVQRCWHADNVRLLPFADEALAASVGATPDELNSEPLNPLAVEVVFDALCESKASFVAREACDARRASFATEDGGFHPQQFTASLQGARRNIATGLAVYPGILIAAGLATAIQLDAMYDHLFLRELSQVRGTVAGSLERNGAFSMAVPVVLLSYSAAAFRRPKFGIAEANLVKGDELYLQEMRRKKRGGRSASGGELEDAAPPEPEQGSLDWKVQRRTSKVDASSPGYLMARAMQVGWVVMLAGVFATSMGS